MLNEIKIPEVGENVESIQIVGIPVKPGDKVAKDQSILELETGKAVVEVPSPFSGTVSQITVSKGDDVKVGQVFAVLETGSGEQSPETATVENSPDPAPTPDAEPVPASDAPGKKPAAQPEPAPSANVQTGRLVPAAPSVRKLARELGIDVNKVLGSGEHGRVSEDDVKHYVRSMHAGKPGSPAGSTQPPLPDFSQWGEVHEEKMSPVRLQTAAHMAVCWSNIPHVTIHDKADITELEGLRKKYADRAASRGGKLTMAVMTTRVVASALKNFPRLNASIDMAGRRIIYKDYVHIGIAISTERGLLVPAIRNADRKNMVELAVEISALAERARTGKLKMEEMQGGTFTVTNLGRTGGSYFTPIVNYPEVAILGMGRTLQEPPMQAGGEPRTFLPLSLSFDHRIIDGSEGAACLRWIVEAIEEPLVLALEG